MDDLQAIHRLKQGDIGGLEHLIARYQGKALRTAFLITQDELLAEDAVQDAFIRFYQHARGFDDLRPFEPYFMRTVVNTALNVLQKEKKVWCTSEPGAPNLESLLDQAASVEDQVEFNALKRRIRTALSGLAPRQRAVIVQRYYLQMSEDEMAAALDAPPGTVKWLLNAARKHLRTLLGSERWTE